MRIYLDNDVPLGVQDRLRHLGEVTRAWELGREETPDELAYCLAVRERYDLIVTCNTKGARGFVAETLRHLHCDREELPIPVYEMKKGNEWEKIRQNWERHEANIEAKLATLGQEHEKRRDRAIEVLAQLEQTATAKQEAAQKMTHERMQNPEQTQANEMTRKR